jgi:hypothetical protein
MNLHRLFSWKSPQSQSNTIENSSAIPQEQISKPEIDGRFAGNLAHLASPVTGYERGQEIGADRTFADAAIPPIRFNGLINAPELTAFFAENYFGLGRHNGAHFRTQEALELGRSSLISKFQNTLAGLLGRKQERINRLQRELIAIEGLSPATSSQLRLACEHLEREILELQQQIEKASEGKGWVLESLNRYQIGFLKGLREAIDFELLVG